MKTFKKLIFLLTPQEQKKAGLLLMMILIMAILDMIGVASILPFTAVLTNPELIQKNIFLREMYDFSMYLGVSNERQFLFALGLIVFALLIASLSFKSLTTYAQVRFVQMREYSIGRRLVEGYLHQPYGWFLNQNSANLGKNIFSEVGQVVGGGITPLMDLIAKSAVALALIILLVLADPKLAFIIGISLGGAYSFIFYFIKNYLNEIGKKRLKNNRIRFTTLSEAFGASKEVKVAGLENFYIERFSKSAQTFAKTQASLQVLAQLPRFVLEAVAFGGVLLIIIYMISQRGNFNEALPLISLYVFAGYRLMPALQQIYSSFTILTFAGPSLDKLYKDIKNLNSYSDSYKPKEIISFKKSIILKNIHFNYQNSSRKILKNINMEIPVNKTIGIVGTTGSGKTTTIDIILGLLEPQKGTLHVDNSLITKENSRAWQKSIGYVPQNIYLSDDTIEANIAFGENSENIKQKQVKKVSKIANLDEFITNELPNQYQTTIGERGVRLSGGQRQRIGIARALYHNPKVLIMDEATSALDNDTERAVMDAVNILDKQLTIIMIAHRINTLKNCDIIFKLEKGEIVYQGNFEYLLKSSNIN